MVKAILFDIDGTLVDSNDLHAEAWAQAFRHFGFDIAPDQVRGQIGKGGDNLIPSLIPGIDGEREEEIADYRSELFKRDYLPRVTPFPGVRALFERVAADGIRIVLASSAKAEEVDHHLALIEAQDLVSDTVSADEVENSKPDPDIFQAGLDKLGLPSTDVLVVGDTPWDVKAAAKGGLRTIGFRSGGFTDEELSGAGAVELFDGPQDMLNRYDESVLAAQACA